MIGLAACGIVAVVLFFVGVAQGDDSVTRFWWMLALLALLWPFVSLIRWMWLHPLSLEVLAIGDPRELCVEPAELCKVVGRLSGEKAAVRF